MLTAVALQEATQHQALVYQFQVLFQETQKGEKEMIQITSEG